MKKKRYYPKLRGRITEKFGRQEEFAAAMGMDRTGLSKRLNRRCQWSGDEVVKACDLLGIPLHEAHLYFFYERSCDNATKQEGA